jgi:hypothetical protein
MQPILKSKRALVAAAILVSTSNVSVAGTGTFPVTASTIPDVTIAVVPGFELNFGDSIRATSGLSCTLDASGPAEDDIQSDLDNDATGAEVATAWGTLSGTGCLSGGTGVQPGLYEITGTPGSNVTVSVAASTASTEFTYTPGNGCVVDYDNGGAQTADPCIALSTTPVSGVTFPDSETNADAVDGSLRFSLGGTVAITNGGSDLTAGTAYTTTFDVTVVYE